MESVRAVVMMLYIMDGVDSDGDNAWIMTYCFRSVFRPFSVMPAYQSR